MLKKPLLILSIFVVTSCSFKSIQYTYNFNTFQNGIDFKKASGNWILNTINLNKNRDNDLTKLAFNKFSSWTDKKIIKKENIKDSKGKTYTFNIPTKPSEEDLMILAKTTNYNYLVNIFSARDTDNNRTREIEVFINIYDLTNQKIMLSEQVIGFLNKEEGTNFGDDSFKINVTPDMISKILKKGLKKIEENSNY